MKSWAREFYRSAAWLKFEIEIDDDGNEIVNF